jgi:hypothetical protein
MESSRCSHPSSNLNMRLHDCLGIQVVNNMGAWSDNLSIHSRPCTDTIGYLSSQSVSICMRSSFSYIGSGKLLAHVNCRPTIETSLKSKLSMTTLNKKGQQICHQTYHEMNEKITENLNHRITGSIDFESNHVYPSQK